MEKKKSNKKFYLNFLDKKFFFLLTLMLIMDDDTIILSLSNEERNVWERNNINLLCLCVVVACGSINFLMVIYAMW